MSAGTKRITLSAVTLMSSPASAQRCVNTPQGFCQLHPDHQTLAANFLHAVGWASSAANSCASTFLRCSPTRAAWASKPSSSHDAMVSTPARMARDCRRKLCRGFPAGDIGSLARPTTAPTGTPGAQTLGQRHHIGHDARPLVGKPLPVRPMPHCTSSIISNQSRSSHRLANLSQIFHPSG